MHLDLQSAAKSEWILVFHFFYAVNSIMMINKDRRRYKSITQCVCVRQCVSARFLSDFLSLEACRLWRLPSRLPIRKDKGRSWTKRIQIRLPTHTAKYLFRNAAGTRDLMQSLCHFLFFPSLSLSRFQHLVLALFLPCAAPHS